MTIYVPHKSWRYNPFIYLAQTLSIFPAQGQKSFFLTTLLSFSSTKYAIKIIKSKLSDSLGLLNEAYDTDITFPQISSKCFMQPTIKKEGRMKTSAVSNTVTKS